MNRILDVATSFLASGLRFGLGSGVAGGAPAPPVTQVTQVLELYEFEACPFCRKVREGLTAFDLDAVIYPCPRGSRYRATVLERGGKAMFPFLVDPGTGAEMYESDDILRYLARTYQKRVPLGLRLGPLTALTSALASGVRPSRGRRARPAREAAQPLELWSFEASPYCRLVREALCELTLPYRLHNVGRGSAARASFLEVSGRMMVPYLKDPNTGAALFESAAIVAYLEKTYAT
jgi:glutathione S-transferase